MRIHYLQHVPFEDLGYIDQWASQRDHSISKTSLFLNEPMPDLSRLDCLMILGGPMGVYDTSDYPWLKKEKQFIERAMERKKSVLGICLGAQLIADVLGARVYKNRYSEIGWHAVSRTKTAEQSPLQHIFPKSFYAFHWHGDTFDLPTGAVHLAESQACSHQAFSYGPRITGLQFHLESTQANIEKLIKHCGNELVPGPYIQNVNEIQDKSDLIEPSNRCMESVLDFMEFNFKNNPGNGW